jgi:hypothetical protein
MNGRLAPKQKAAVCFFYFCLSFLILFVFKFCSNISTPHTIPPRLPTNSPKMPKK